MKLFPLASIPSASRSRLFFPEQRLEESLSFFPCLRIINSPRAYLGGTSGAYLIQPTLKSAAQDLFRSIYVHTLPSSAHKDSWPVTLRINDSEHTMLEVP